MNCRQAEIALSRHLDGELSAREMTRLEAHLSACPDCRRTASEWSEIGSALRAAGPARTPDPARAWQSIHRTIRQDDGTTVPAVIRPRWRTTLPWAGLAAAAVLALAILFVPGGPGSEPSPFSSSIEFVETDLPGASTVVYLDDESGWTIVWVVEPAPATNSAS